MTKPLRRHRCRSIRFRIVLCDTLVPRVYEGFDALDFVFGVSCALGEAIAEVVFVGIIATEKYRDTDNNDTIVAENGIEVERMNASPYGFKLNFLQCFKNLFHNSLDFCNYCAKVLKFWCVFCNKVAPFFVSKEAVRVANVVIVPTRKAVKDGN